MKTSLSRGCALSFCAAAILVGCGGSQPPIRVLGAMPQSAAIAAHAEHGRSWMLPEVASQSLLYVSDLNGVVTRTNLGHSLSVQSQETPTKFAS